MNRAARHRRDPVPVARFVHRDTTDLRDIGLRSVTLYSERDPRAAAIALARGASRQTRGAKVSIVAALVEELAEREPGLFDDCLAYLAKLRSARPAA